MLMLKEDNRTLTGGLGESAAFKVEMNAMLFHSVIDGIYADKIRAPLRELTTNARDGHAAAGKLDVPFDVYLPSKIDPTFKVRDYGCSLSHDDIMGLYSTMFASSKRDSNEAVGMIGLGSKSPFAYTSVFTVAAILEGEKRIYTAFIGDDGVPQIALLDRVNTNDPTGIEVQFPVNQEDVEKFRTAARDVLFGFDPYPNILNETYVRPVPEVVYQGDRWAMYKANTVPFGNRLMVRQGCVLYPVDPTPLGISNNLVFTQPILMDFDIGQLSVSTSREALGYDERTVAVLKTRIDATLAELTQLAASEISNAPSYIEACSIFEAGLTYGNAKRTIYEVLRHQLIWGDKPLKTVFDFQPTQKNLTIHYFDPDVVELGIVKEVVAHKPKTRKIHISARTFHKETSIFVDNPETCKNAPSRMRRALSEVNPRQRVLWVRLTDPDGLADLKAQIGDKPYTLLETIEPLKLERNPYVATGGATTQNFRYIAPQTSWPYGTHLQPTFDHRAPGKDMVYILQEGARYKRTDDSAADYSYSEIYSKLYDPIAAGILPAGFKVYCLNKQNRKVLETTPMTPFAEYVRQQLLTRFSMQDIVDAASPQDLSYANRMAVAIIKARDEHGLTFPKCVRDFLDEHQNGRTAKVVAVNSSLINCARYYTPDEFAAVSQSTNPVLALFEEVQERYPLLQYCLDQSHNPTYLKHYLELIAQ